MSEQAPSGKLSNFNQQECLEYIQNQTQLNIQKIKKVLELKIIEECTIPFITRYRKEATGGMDEVQIQNIINQHEKYEEREKRRQFIIEKLTSEEKLTPELKAQLSSASTINQLEDIYAPFKTKKKSKGTVAREKGLGPLAEKALTGKIGLDQLEKEQESLINPDKDLPTTKEVLTGIKDIITETITQNGELKEKLRHSCLRIGVYKSSKRKKAEEVTGFEKYKDYFEFSQKISDLGLDKNAHRFLAMRRGMNEKVLKIELEFEFEDNISIFRSFYLPKEHNLLPLMKECCEQSFNKYLKPSLDLEFKSDLKQSADQAAIQVFGVNLKNLLLMPYLGPKKVLGIDPGVRTGCKIVIVDDSGKFLEDDVVYPFPPKNEKNKSAETIKKLVEKHQVQHIAIGNGTYGRETLQFVEQEVLKKNKLKAHATMISEAGASIYSTSENGRKEFPKLDPTVRGAISIARRFQDPLAELVKIDAKSIGVGQYQHDVNQSKLNISLQGVVENCVNYVGVDLNTASAPLLSFVSGIGPSLAQNIVSHREKNGPFKSREELKKVSRFSEKVFVQAAGFLRIYSGANPLDSTFIHPEKYHLINQWSKDQGLNVSELISDKNTISKLNSDRHFQEEVGEFTHKDIIDSLLSPTKDPREEFKSMEFREDISEFKDLKSNEWYPGVVTNITNFGAFVDIGIKENGLLHISQMSDQFVKNPMDILKVGDQITVKVIELDPNRKRISLSRKGATKNI